MPPALSGGGNGAPAKRGLVGRFGSGRSAFNRRWGARVGGGNGDRQTRLAGSGAWSRRHRRVAVPGMPGTRSGCGCLRPLVRGWWGPAQAAKAHKVRQRQDTAREWAKAVVRDHDQIAVEDFRPRFLIDHGPLGRRRGDRHRRAGSDRDGPQAGTDRAPGGSGACCGARAKHHPPPFRQDLYMHRVRCLVPRDKNSARVMLVGLVSSRLTLIVEDLNVLRTPGQCESGIPSLPQGGEDVNPPRRSCRCPCR